MVAVYASTSSNWFSALKGLSPEPREVAFWRPTDAKARQIAPGEPWFFKEWGAPQILGFGRFVRHQTSTPAKIWSEFGPACGAESEEALIADLTAARGKPTDQNTVIGNVVLSDFTALPKPILLGTLQLENLTAAFRYVPAGNQILKLAARPTAVVDPPSDLNKASRRELATEVFARNVGHVAYIRGLYRGVCQVTGTTVLGGIGGDLTQVHHIDFLCNGGPDDPANMMALSPDWHALAHASGTTFDWQTLEFVVAGRRFKLAVNRHLKPRRR